MLAKLFDELEPSWNNKLIGASSDGARNMAGSVSGVITRIQRECLPGFSRVWCLLHQLDIPLQDAYLQLSGGEWYATLVAMISLPSEATDSCFIDGFDMPQNFDNLMARHVLYHVLAL